MAHTNPVLAGVTASIGSALDQCTTIEEVDGSPSSQACEKLLVSNGSLIDNSNGTFTLSGGSGDITDVNEGFAIDVTTPTGPAPTVIFDPTEFLGSRTWGDASTDTIVWTWDRTTGTDPTLTFGSATVTGIIVAATTGFEVNGERVTDWTGSGISIVAGALTSAGGAEVNNLETLTTGILTTEIPIGTAADTVVYAALSGDVTMTNGGLVTIGADKVALATDTTGNYVAAVTTSVLTGLTGGNVAAENTSSALAFDYTATLAGNPALAASNCVFATTGLICEGLTADLIETLLTFTDPLTTDKTITFPNETGTVCTTGSICAGTVTYVGTTRTLTGGVGIAALGDLSADRTVTFDATEISSLTWGAGAFTTMTFDAGATDPVLTAASGSLTLTTGDLGIATSSKMNFEGSAGDTYSTFDGTTWNLYVNGINTISSTSSLVTIATGIPGDTLLGDSTLRVMYPQTAYKMDFGKTANPIRKVVASTMKSIQATAPTIGTPATCGTSPSASVLAGSTDMAGQFTITTGSVAPTLCTTTITFNGTYEAAPKSVVLSLASTTTLTLDIYTKSMTTTTFVVEFGGTPTASTAYKFYYLVLE